MKWVNLLGNRMENRFRQTIAGEKKEKFQNILWHLLNKEIVFFVAFFCINTAKIYFDDSKISEQELSKIISELNDKQFSIGSSTVSDYKAEEKTTTSSETKSSGSVGAQSSFSDLEQATFEIKTPNLIDLLLSALVRG